MTGFAYHVIRARARMRASVTERNNAGSVALRERDRHYAKRSEYPLSVHTIVVN